MNNTAKLVAELQKSLQIDGNPQTQKMPETPLMQMLEAEIRKKAEDRE
jgi:hypothetical protein